MITIPVDAFLIVAGMVFPVKMLINVNLDDWIQRNQQILSLSTCDMDAQVSSVLVLII